MATANTEITQTMTIPQDMQAALLDGFGGPEVLKPGTRPVPKPAAGEVLVAVAAAGVNRPNVMQRQGMYPAPSRRWARAPAALPSATG